MEYVPFGSYLEHQYQSLTPGVKSYYSSFLEYFSKTINSQTIDAWVASFAGASLTEEQVIELVNTAAMVYHISGPTEIPALIALVCDKHRITPPKKAFTFDFWIQVSLQNSK